MNQPIVMGWHKSRDFSLVWNIRRKLAAGFSVMILVVMVSGLTIWSQLQSVAEISEALGSLNPLAKNNQYLAQDVNAYLQGHQERRQAFSRHVNDFETRWQEFSAHQAEHEEIPPLEQVLMDKVYGATQAYIDNSLSLFDDYDKHKVTQARLEQNVSEALVALNKIVDAHIEQFSEHQLNFDSTSDSSVESSNEVVDQAVNRDIRIDLYSMINALQSYLLGDTSKKETISQGVVNFQRSMEFFFDHLTQEPYLTDNYPSQVDVVKSNWLQIGGDTLKLIKLQDGLNDRWQQADRASDKLDMLISDLVKTHENQIESTRDESDQFVIFVIISSILIGIGASVFMGNMITVPIMDLITMVRDFGQGKQGQRMKVHSNDEIGELGLAFNQMADDITDYQIELEDAQDSIFQTQRLTELGQLISTVSHEIRNPLSAIRAAIYSIGNHLDGQNSGITKTLGRAERGIDRCDNIIEELRDYSRTTELEMKGTLIDDWIEKVLDDQTIDPSINLTVKLEAGATVRLDQIGFQGCFINIINNACQAMIESEEEGVARNLTVNTSRNDDAIVIRVTDSGPGIKADILEKIFEPMFTTRALGVGLGLSIVKKVIEQHHGRVEIDSQLGEGTTVSLWLPIDNTGEI